MHNTSTWIAIILALAVAAVLFKLLRAPRHKEQDRQQPEPTMVQSPALNLSVVEQCCLQTLQQVAGAEFNIRNKVLLSELLNGSTLAGQQKELLQRLDFVLFSKKFNKPTCAVQLQSLSGNDESRMTELLEQAGVRLYRLPRKSSYSMSAMQKLLQPHLEKPTPSPDEMIATISMTAFRQCKKCHAQMELKRASGGAHKGMLFWVCKGYPQCPGVELYTE
ncbi:MAG: hypothetical protein CO187_07325 [Zetaproteobacteria bacterium CG_4_9_14_3_um_filter_53_7]|nr:MAG: hypothetical protein CO187_07325 [Zetaproteobacteria bacterium CG_4_9_14_3_um_filter_53_7]